MRLIIFCIIEHFSPSSFGYIFVALIPTILLQDNEMRLPLFHVNNSDIEAVTTLLNETGPGTSCGSGVSWHSLSISTL